MDILETRKEQRSQRSGGLFKLPLTYSTVMGKRTERRKGERKGGEGRVRRKGKKGSEGEGRKEGNRMELGREGGKGRKGGFLFIYT